MILFPFYSCSLVDVSYLRELYSVGTTHLLEILHGTVSPDTDVVEFISSINNSFELQRMGLVNCTLLARMQDLISSELAENWHNLKHHVDDGHTLPDKIRDVIAERQYKDKETLDHQVLRRSAEESSDGSKCLEDNCDKQTSKHKEDKDVQEWFSQYVRKVFSSLWGIVK